jgi:hypothetical protein
MKNISEHILKRLIQELTAKQKEHLKRLNQKETLTSEDFQDSLETLLHNLEPGLRDKTIKKMMKKAKIKPGTNLNQSQTTKLKKNLLSKI